MSPFFPFTATQISPAFPFYLIPIVFVDEETLRTDVLQKALSTPPEGFLQHKPRSAEFAPVGGENGPPLYEHRPHEFGPLRPQ